MSDALNEEAIIEKYNHIDRVYQYKGQWDTLSICGLKVVEKSGKTIFIITDLYDINPGTPVTDFSAQLATILLKDFKREPDTCVFIEHVPDRGSRLEHYQESIDVVRYQWDGEKFTNPDWNRITKDEFLQMITP